MKSGKRKNVGKEELEAEKGFQAKEMAGGMK